MQVQALHRIEVIANGPVEISALESALAVAEIRLTWHLGCTDTANRHPFMRADDASTTSPRNADYMAPPTKSRLLTQLVHFVYCCCRAVSIAEFPLNLGSVPQITTSGANTPPIVPRSSGGTVSGEEAW